MDKKLYNSEVRELAKQLYLGKGGEHTFYGDRFPSACITRAKNMIDVLEKEGYYDEEQPHELSDHDKMVQEELNKIVVIGMFTTRVYNAIRYNVPRILNMPEGRVAIGNIIKVGYDAMRHSHHMGKHGMEEITTYLERHNLSWDMDLTKYGL